jgi:deoxyribonuclease-4
MPARVKAPPAPKKPAAAKKTKSSSSPGRIEIPQPKKGPRVLLGAHTSISGGVSLSVPRALALGFTAAQIFVKNNKQWFAPELDPAEIAAFKKARDDSGLYVFGHNSYLVNLGSPKPEIYDVSVKSMTAELLRADSLGLPFLVMHPGSHSGEGEEAGLKKIAQGLRTVLKATPKVKTKLALENTAGQGSSLGHRFEHLGWLLQEMNNPDRFGVCLDTAHLLEAGYDLRTKSGYESICKNFDQTVGTHWLLGFHLNDSKTPLGSRVDRHQHLGEGEVGLDPFLWIVRDERWAKIPKVLETPKGEDMAEDVINLSKLIKTLSG